MASDTYSWQAILSAKDTGLVATIKGALGAMESIDKGFGRFEGSAGKVSAGFDDVGKSAGKSEGLLSKFKSALSLGTVMGAAQQGIQALTGGISDIVSSTMGASDALDKFKSTMQFAGFTKKQTSQASKAMKTYADQTVYELGDVMNTTAQLAANGIPNYQQLTKAAGNLNAVAGGNADTFKSVAMMLTQTAGAGKLTTENWNQLSDAIPGASGKLQEAMKKNGAYTGNFRDAMAAGQITADEFNKAIEQLGMEDAAVKAAKSTKTFEGAIGNLQATVTNSFMQIVDTIGKAGITNAISGIGTAVEKMTPSITSGLTGLIGALTRIGQDAQFAAGGVVKAWQGATKGFNSSGLTRVFQNFGSMVELIVSNITMRIGGIASIVATVAGKITTAFSRVFGKDNGSEKFFWDLQHLVDTTGFIIQGVFQAIGDVISALPWEGMFTAAKGALEGILGILNPMADLISKAMDSDAVKSFAAALLGLAAAFKVIKVGVAAFKALQAAMIIGSLIQGIATGTEGAAAALSALAGESKLAAAAQWAYNAALNADPIVLVVAAVAALTAGLLYFFTQTKTGQKAWATFVSWLQAAWQGLVAIAQTVWTAVTSAFTSAVAGIQTAWSGITGFFSGLWSGIQSGATSAISGIEAGWSAVTGFFSGLWSGIQSAAVATWSAISSFFSGLWSGIVSVAQAAWGVFGDSLTSIWQGIVNVAQGIWEMLKSVIMGPVLLILDLVTGNFTQLGKDAKMIWQSIVSAAQQIWDGLGQYFDGILGVIKDYFTTVWHGILSVLSSVWAGITSTAKSVWSGLTSWLKSTWTSIKTTASSIFTALKNLLPAIWQSIKSTAFSVVKSMVSSVISTWRSLVTGAKSLFSGLKSWLSGLWSGIKSTAWSIVKGMVSSLLSTWRGLVSGVHSIISGVKSAFNALKNFSLADAGRAIMSSLFNGLKSAWSKVTSFVGGIASWIRKHKGPISLDRKLLTPAGTAIMAGLNEGLTDSFTAVQRNVSSMAGAIAQAATPSISMGSISDSVNAANRQLQRGLTANVNGEMLMGSQPAQITLVMGDHEYSAYVGDISTAQDQQVQLDTKYRLKHRG